MHHHSSSKHRRKPKTDRTQTQTQTESRYRSSLVSSKDSPKKHRNKDHGSSVPPTTTHQNSEAEVDFCQCPNGPVTSPGQLTSTPPRDSDKQQPESAGLSSQRSRKKGSRRSGSSVKRSRNKSSNANDTMKRIRSRSKSRKTNTATATTGTVEASTKKREHGRRRGAKMIDSTANPHHHHSVSPTTSSTSPGVSSNPSSMSPGPATSPTLVPVKFDRNQRPIKEQPHHKPKDNEESSSSDSDRDDGRHPGQEVPADKLPKKKLIPPAMEKKDVPDKTKKKKKNNSQDTDNTPTVFEAIDAPVKPLSENFPVIKKESTHDFPKKGTGKAALLVDETPTAYAPVKAKRTPKKDDDSDSNHSAYLPLYAAYK